MTVQLVTRVPDDMVERVDALVESGVVSSRSDAVRAGLEALLDHHRRAAVGEAIVAGYRRIPQTEEELAWARASTSALVHDEPW